MNLSDKNLAYVPKEEIERIREIKSESNDVVSLFADICRINTLYMIAFAGSGHVGSSLSSIDIVSFLYLKQMREVSERKGDVYFSSKGHDAPGLYSVLIGMGLFPFEKLHQLRRLGGLPGHPDVGTPHIATNTGSLGMGISKAKGMAIADKLNGIKRNYYVLLGDGELQEGQFWESLQPTANSGIENIVAIVDHNKLQSDTFVSNVSDLGDLEARIKSCGWEVTRVNGHDINELEKAFNELSNVAGKPKLIIADTVKSKGAGLMESTNFKAEDRLYKFHSGAPPAEIYSAAVEGLINSINGRLKKLDEAPLNVEIVERQVTSQLDSPQKLIDAYSNALLEQAENNSKVLALSADLALDTGLINFEKKFPERFIECGIAEQDMVSTAGGLALNGFLPVVHSFACFLATRPNEQIFNNATEKTKIIYVGSLAGILPAGPGHSHQSIRDIAALSGTPGMTMIEPCCEAEVKMVVDYAINRADGPVYIRLVSIPVETGFSLPADYRLEKGKGCILLEGSDAVIFGYGPVALSEAVKASTLLEGEGIGVKVVNLPWLNSVDTRWLAEVIGKARLVVTIDDHYLEGGQGEFIASAMARSECGAGKKMISLGVTGIAECGKNDEVLKAHGLDCGSIRNRIISVL